MLIFFIILVVYLVGFVCWFRNRLRVYLNNWDKLSSYEQRQGGFSDLDDRRAGATMMALFWPITCIIPLLATTVKTDKQVREVQEKKSRELELERAVFKKQAQELNIPGWENI